LTFTACDELFEATYDTWYEREVEYQGDNGGIQLNFYCIYSKNGIQPSTSNKLKNNPFGDETVGIPAGLTVVCRPFIGSDNEALAAIGDGFTENNYLIKNWPSLNNIQTESEEGVIKHFDSSKGTWKSIILFGGVQYGSMPACLKDTQEGRRITPMNMENFNWKKIMAQILINKYLSE
jgi:hypothetical protein